MNKTNDSLLMNDILADVLQTTRDVLQKEREINKVLTEALEWTAASSMGDIKLAASAALAKAEEMRK